MADCVRIARPGHTADAWMTVTDCCSNGLRFGGSLLHAAPTPAIWARRQVRSAPWREAALRKTLPPLAAQARVGANQLRPSQWHPSCKPVRDDPLDLPVLRPALRSLRA